MGVNLDRADLFDANLNGVNLFRARLFKAHLAQADLRNANLSWANLDVADLTCALLDNAKLKNASLNSANLAYARLYGVDLNGVDTADIRYAYIDGHVICVDRIGSRKRGTIYNATKNIVWCGCFRGTFEEWVTKIRETYPDEKNVYRKEYEAAIAFFKAVAEANKGEAQNG